ncbi:MAG: PspA/IM30 family protein [Rhodothermaceae bacterium]|nr:PspA/IM30 family protein [Rhodothermaceae bacterium]
MSIWKRFKRLMKSIFGGAISAMEDPKLILEQNIRELNDQVPKMNENIATVKANVMLLQKEHRRYTAEQTNLTAKIKAAIQAGRDDIAQRYAVQLQGTKEAQARTGEQLQFAEQAYEKSLQVKKAFMREREKKIGEAKEALRAHERAKWQAKIADTLEQFEVAGVDATHDEMINRVNESTAKNEARMEMALDSIDTEALQIEEDAQEIQAAELVKQFKLEMGLSEPEQAPAAPEPELRIPEAEESGGDAAPSERQRERTE